MHMNRMKSEIYGEVKKRRETLSRKGELCGLVNHPWNFFLLFVTCGNLDVTAIKS